MSLRHAVTTGLRNLLRKDATERDLDDEVRHYLEMAIQAHLRAGISRTEAERRARIDMGGVEATKDDVRSGGWEAHVETLWQDVRYGARGLRRNPAFTAVAVITLALGIGANTAMFSVVNAVMLRPLPYADPNRLALLWTNDPKRGLAEEGTAYRTIVDWRTKNRTFSDMAFFTAQTSVLVNGDVRERARSAYVSANTWNVLGVPPLLGRTLTVDDEQRFAQVAVISYALWQRRFGGDPNVLGKRLEMDHASKFDPPPPRIVGVTPPGFYFPDKQTDFWMPVTMYWRWQRESSERFPAWVRRWTVVARLNPGASIGDARADMAAIGQSLSRAYRSDVADFPGFSANVVPILEHVTGKQLQLALWVLLGAVGLVLLVACANVANLLLARGATRHQEFAVRRALGAGRGRLARQLLVESMLLGATGGALGVALAVFGAKALSFFAAAHIPRLEEVAIDGPVLVFAAAASVAASIVFGIAPAFRMSGVSPNESLKEGPGQAVGSRRLHRTRGVLVLAECSLAIVLLAAAGLLVRSLIRLQAVDPGFKPDRVMSVRLAFPSQFPPLDGPMGTLSPDQARAAHRATVLHELTDRIKSVTSVAGASFADDAFIRGEANESITIPGHEADTLGAGQLYAASVTPEFFAMMGVPLHAGRSLSDNDVFTKVQALWHLVHTDQSLAQKEAESIPEPVVVNDAFVRRFFPGQRPIGKRFCIDPTNKTYWYTIVGVVGDMRRQGLERQAIPEYFQVFIPQENAELLVRTRGDPLAVATTVRQLVMSAMPGTIVLDVTTVDRRMGDMSAQRRVQTWLLTLFAGVALLLAAIGIYGVVHYAVAERTREIGVRIALGAAASDVMGMVIAQGMRLPVAGITLGLVAAVALTRVMSHLLFETGTTDPVTFAGVAALLASVAFVACYLPARRATQIDPVRALRHE